MKKCSLPINFERKKGKTFHKTFVTKYENVTILGTNFSVIIGSFFWCHKFMKGGNVGTPKDVILKVGIFISILKYEVVVTRVGTVCILAIHAQDITVRK